MEPREGLTEAKYDDFKRDEGKPEGGITAETEKEETRADEGNLHRVLLICTNTQDSSWGAKTGLWFEELSTPYYIFSEAGFECDIASINGEEIAVDPGEGYQM